MSQTKLQIPQPGFPTPIVGILQRARPEEKETRGKPVILVRFSLVLPVQQELTRE